MSGKPGRPILVVTDRSNLSISSELLSVAARVDGDRQRGHAS